MSIKWSDSLLMNVAGVLSCLFFAVLLLTLVIVTVHVLYIFWKECVFRPLQDQFCRRSTALYIPGKHFKVGQEWNHYTGRIICVDVDDEYTYVKDANWFWRWRCRKYRS